MVPLADIPGETGPLLIRVFLEEAETEESLRRGALLLADRVQEILQQS
jgi:hypothetical protein